MEDNKFKLDEILNRNKIKNNVIEYLNEFEKNKNNPLRECGIYIYGDTGIGKTTFVHNILVSMNYDVIKYDTSCVRNTTMVENITKNNISDKNIFYLLKKESRKIAIIMDEIDGMNCGDKGGINTLIKVIRQKKTKKQKTEDTTSVPIICISNCHIDKKIKELMKVCLTIKLNTPTVKDMKCIINDKNFRMRYDNDTDVNNIISYANNNLRKLFYICNIYKTNRELFTEIISSCGLDHIKDNNNHQIINTNSYENDTKNIIKLLLNNKYNLNQHNNIINDTDRTSVALLWHENIIDQIQKIDPSIGVPFYIKQLENMCFSDYIDRITFQKQIWQLNEMSSLIKTFYNSKLYHELNIPFKQKGEIRFTKILTKYSSEYNNFQFIKKICNKLSMEKKEVFPLFLFLRKHFTIADIINKFELVEITKLEIERMYRYMDNLDNSNHNDCDAIYEDDI